MTEACIAHATGGDRGLGAMALGIVKWLRLAATPTFAIMALLTGVIGAGPTHLMCSAEHGSTLSGMVPMYLLMSAFHSAPWWELLSGARRAIRRS